MLSPTLARVFRRGQPDVDATAVDVGDFIDVHHPIAFPDSGSQGTYR